MFIFFKFVQIFFYKLVQILFVFSSNLYRYMYRFGGKV